MFVYLETPLPRHEHDFLAAVVRSRRLHGSWVTAPSSAAEYRLYLKERQGPRHFKFFVCDDARQICGVINLSEVMRGSFQSGFLGYYALLPHAGKGYMSAGLELVVERAFGELGLHRLEANIQPKNRRSIELVQRAGFRCEGLSPRYLQIAGRWRDHERWALTVEDRRVAGRPKTSHVAKP
ncbi:MAG TPA: GNAT family N-acetyltransferase [Polyangiaceae bacterium]|nr:GNAT family N-acetyltransferase [Polyangiaceae bacterium]